MTKLRADIDAIRADLERFGVGSRLTLDRENILDMALELEQSRTEIERLWVRVLTDQEWWHGLEAEIERLREALELIAPYPHIAGQIARAALDRNKGQLASAKVSRPRA